MGEEGGASQVSRGARIYMRERDDKKDCPTSVKGADHDRWVQKRLTVWQKETRHIFRLFDTYALQLLDDLHGDNACQAGGIVVGEPVVLRTCIFGPDRCSFMDCLLGLT